MSSTLTVGTKTMDIKHKHLFDVLDGMVEFEMDFPIVAEPGMLIVTPYGLVININKVEYDVVLNVWRCSGIPDSHIMQELYTGVANN